MLYLYRIEAAFSIHSYGNVLIFPWGYANVKHRNRDKMSKLAYKMVNEIKWWAKVRYSGFSFMTNED